MVTTETQCVFVEYGVMMDEVQVNVNDFSYVQNCQETTSYNAAYIGYHNHFTTCYNTLKMFS